MGAYLLDWLQLFFRWFHVLAGIAWIGASFYFVWLDMSLEKPPEWKQKKGISGDLWAVHGGGFYEVAKYQLEPESMPKTLHWFKWEAYTTWLTGMVMLILVYYINATAYLIDPSKVAFGSSVGAIATSLLFLLVNYIVYEVLARSAWGKNAFIFSTCMFIILVFDSWLAYQLFNDRAAYIHVGAVLGSVMAGNVFFGIMPAQRALVACVQEGRKPDKEVARLALQAKNRSLMNNYFTLPVVFIMISNHYPMTYSHGSGWQVLVFIGVITATVRHYFNLKHRGIKRRRYLVIPAILTVLLIIWMRPAPIEPIKSVSATNALSHAPSRQSDSMDTKNLTDSATPTPIVGLNGETQKSSSTVQSPQNQSSSDESVLASAVSSANNVAKNDPHAGVMQIVKTRCTTCHAAQPTQAGFNAPPAGIVLQTPDDLKLYQTKTLTAVQSGYMPLGNITGLTDDERTMLLSYVSGL